MKTPLSHDASELLFRLPGTFQAPAFVAPDDMWLWDLYERSNFIKHVCLLGVRFHLLTHEPGSMTLPAYLRRRGE